MILQNAAPEILVVDDEPKLLAALEPSFRAAGFGVTTAACGTEALNLFAAGEFDAVVLDLGLPDMDGKQVIHRMREWARTPIIVLSARNISQEKIDALDGGADDFVNKPFEIGELMARIRVVLRRAERRESPFRVFRSGEFTIDFGRRTATLGGSAIHFSPREIELLKVLAQKPGQAMTHKRLIAAIWGAETNADTQWLRVLVSIVRQKIELEPSNPKILITEPGLGYALVGEEG